MQTSIFVDNSVISQISYFSNISGFSRAYIVKSLLDKLDKVYCHTPTQGCLIRYQRHCPESGFSVFHLRLNSLEKCKLEEMRARYKTSVSFLLLIAFLLFFKKLVRKVNKIKNMGYKFIDNYTRFAKNIMEKIHNFCMLPEKIP